MTDGGFRPEATEDPTVVDQPAVTAGADAGGGTPPQEPPGGGDGQSGGDEEQEWYQKPAVLAGIGAAVLLIGVLVGFLVFGGDDDGDSAAATSTTSTSTTTTTTTTAPPTDQEPATPAPETPDTPGSPEGDPDADLATARSNWAANGGQQYSFSYFVGGEGGEQRFCVSGFAGDPGSVTDVTGACGDDLAAGGMAVEEWFDFIEGSLAAGTFLSAEYDPTNGYPISATFDLLDMGSYRVDFLTFAE